MEISEHIISEAREILQNNPSSLPAQITSAPLFFVANENDPTVQAFYAISYDGIVYKIGSKKN